MHLLRCLKDNNAKRYLNLKYVHNIVCAALVTMHIHTYVMGLCYLCFNNFVFSVLINHSIIAKCSNY